MTLQGASNSQPHREEQAHEKMRGSVRVNRRKCLAELPVCVGPLYSNVARGAIVRMFVPTGTKT